MNRYELIEFFGVLPVIDEEDCYESYKVIKKHSVLEVTFFYPTDVCISIFHKEFDEETFSAKFEGEIRMERRVYKNNYDCLELIIPYSERAGEEDWNHSLTVRVFIEPTIRVEILN